MRKEVCRPPQELDAGTLLGTFEVRNDRLEVAIGLGQRRSVRRHVPIVKAIKRRPQLGDELKGRVDPPLGVVERLAAVIPGTLQRRGTERIGPRRPERVPVADAEPQMLAERLCLRRLRPGCSV